MSLYEIDETPKICPKCSSKFTKITQIYEVKSENVRRRRRECLVCGHKYTTNTPKEEKHKTKLR